MARSERNIDHGCEGKAIVATFRIHDSNAVSGLLSPFPQLMMSLRRRAFDRKFLIFKQNFICCSAAALRSI